MKKLSALALAGIAALSATFSCAGPIGDVNARDLTKLTTVTWLKGEPVTVVRKGVAEIPWIVYRNDGDCKWAAEQVRNTIKEMTGAELKLVAEWYNPDGSCKKELPNAPAIYVGDVAAARKAGLAAPTTHKEAFRVTVKDGSIYLLGKAAFAATDFCERYLGARFYWPMKPNELYGTKGTNFIYGKCTVKTSDITVKCVDWSDQPKFAYRDNWPYEGNVWNRWGKGGNSHRGGVAVHAPHGWWKEADAKDHVEIFALSTDGKRPNSPLLCYGNPKTVEYYEKRTEEGIKAYNTYISNKDPKKGRFKDPAGGILNYANKVVTISQWDCGVECACEYCKKLYDEKLGSSGSGSPIIWGFFTKQYAKWLKANHPDWMISILPYINTCDVPPDPNDPSKPLSLKEEGNVEAMLCTMPGLAMLKNKECKAAEEKLIRQWIECTGNPVLNWHYSCWPAEFTSAPYVYGETIQKHYKDLEKELVGTFINGQYEAPRMQLSAYVWMRCLWNPDVDVKAIYDGFCNRMFGKAAGKMRQLVALQESCWNRQWGSNMCSAKNVHQISYPTNDVAKMVKLLDESQALAKDDEQASARIAWYRTGFERFFKESEDMASGAAFEPLKMKKASRPPVIDGKLDDPCWATAEESLMVNARDKVNKTPPYRSAAKIVWYPGETGGITVGFDFEEPATFAMKQGVAGDSWGQDNIEIFLDPSGSADGHFYQLVVDATGRYTSYTDGIEWKPAGVKAAAFIGEGKWSMEVFIPFSDLKNFPKVALPTTSANGIVWIGNLNRWRVGDRCLPKEKQLKDSKMCWTRLFTRYSGWNKDPAAFGPLPFVE